MPEAVGNINGEIDIIGHGGGYRFQKCRNILPGLSVSDLDTLQLASAAQRSFEQRPTVLLCALCTNRKQQIRPLFRWQKIEQRGGRKIRLDNRRVGGLNGVGCRLWTTPKHRQHHLGWTCRTI